MNDQNEHPYSFDQLQAFVDGGLDQAISGQVERHLVSCPECRKTVAKIRALGTRTAQAFSGDAPETYFTTFASRVSSRIAFRQQAPRARRSWRAWWGLVPAAAAAVL
ncbi:MAG TPA: zf-HC2 domain-containing protein, partial [Candidatus Edwardsbacteria bacterium]|nr:zf-HC2 domain-containing protein [Candidatus Edwardsbacteria bacterium]